jgi:hypothetical protein
MDLPWNPAVLEQRIGRVHRMGQRSSVQVVNFVAQGSIEEGMLQVLAFKKSLSSGVLDGGPGEVFLQGTRLSKFMEGVERVTQAVAPADVSQGGEEVQAPAAQEPVQPSVAANRAPAADAWAALLEAGLAVLSELAAGSREPGAGPAAWVETDADTGRACLKLPLPEPATLERVAQSLGALARAMRPAVVGDPPPSS